MISRTEAVVATIVRPQAQTDGRGDPSPTVYGKRTVRCIRGESFLIMSGKIDGFLRRTSQRDEGVLFVRRGEAAWLCGERRNFKERRAQIWLCYLGAFWMNL